MTMPSAAAMVDPPERRAPQGACRATLWKRPVMLDRWIHTQTTIEAAFETAARNLTLRTPEILRAAFALSAAEPSDDGSFTLRDMLVSDTDVEQVDLRASIDTAVRAGNQVRLAVGWRPQATADAYSSLDGQLELSVDSSGTTVLALDASYRVPPATHHPTVIMTATQRLARQVVRAIATQLDSGDAVGRRLVQLRVRELMTSPAIMLHTQQSLLSATLVLLHRDISGAPVVDEAARLVGVFSESDMLAREASPRTRGGWEAREEHRRRHAQTVGEACSRPPATIHPDSTVREAARRLLDRDVGRLIVTDESGIVGVLSRHDVLRSLTRTAEQLQHAVERAIERLHEPRIRVALDPCSRVRLTGVAGDLATVTLAARLAGTVDGVSGVDNHLTWDETTTTDLETDLEVLDGTASRPTELLGEVG
jgi:CBS domain-containing protein